MSSTAFVQNRPTPAVEPAAFPGRVVLLANRSKLYGQAQGNMPWDSWRVPSAFPTPMTTPFKAIAHRHCVSVGTASQVLNMHPTPFCNVPGWIWIRCKRDTLNICVCTADRLLLSTCWTGYIDREAVSKQPVFRLSLSFSFHALKSKGIIRIIS